MPEGQKKDRQIHFNTALGAISMLLSLFAAGLTYLNVSSGVVAHLNAAEFALDHGEIEEASTELDGDLNRWLKPHLVQLIRARLRATEGNGEDAVRMLRKVIENRPDVPIAYFRLGQLLFQDGLDQRKHQREGSSTEDWVAMLSEARDLLRSATTIPNPSDLPESLRISRNETRVALGEAFLKSSDLPRRERFEKALALCSEAPRNAAAAACNGQIYMLQGRWDSAIEAFSTARSLDQEHGKPEHPGYLRRLGFSYYKSHDFGEAKSALERSLELEENAATRRLLKIVEYELAKAEDKE